jgi:hypothetical protein
VSQICNRKKRISVTDWAASAAASSAGIGLIFAGFQVLLTRRQAIFEGRVALNGVAVSWEAIEAPDHPDEDGTAEWFYRITIHNPARMPIDEIEIKWHFPCEVRRVRYSGRRGQPTEELTLEHPVLAGLDKRTWNRRLRVDFENASKLRHSYSLVTFKDVNNARHTNRWPRVPNA